MVVRDARIVGFSGFGAFELFTMRLHGTLAGHPPCLLDRLHIVGQLRGHAGGRGHG